MQIVSKEAIYRICQILFLGKKNKNKQNVTSLLSAELVLRVKSSDQSIYYAIVITLSSP